MTKIEKVLLPSDENGNDQETLKLRALRLREAKGREDPVEPWYLT